MKTLGGETIMDWQVSDLVSSCKCYLHNKRNPFRLIRRTPGSHFEIIQLLPSQQDTLRECRYSPPVWSDTGRHPTNRTHPMQRR